MILDFMIFWRIFFERCVFEEYKFNIIKEKFFWKFNFVGDKFLEIVIELMNDDGFSRMYEVYFMLYDQFCILICWWLLIKLDGKGM